MKLAYKVFLTTLTILTLAFMVSAQTLRPEKDNRNIAPTVGTGGPVGGPTGLFTVYDGQTLRRGEFTFSVAYSNFDRDPGDVDIVEVPLSFQIGLSDNLELFFNTDGYRAVKVNSPRNLSSFYLPNATFGNQAAIVLAPNGLLGGQFAGQAVFRPAGSQPFVGFPFIGGSAGNFGFPGTQSGNPVLGVTPGGAADNFPGIGSIYGSILPGVVLTTVGVGPGGVSTAPASFSTAPSYLNDAPLIGRQYGTSSFNTFTVGGKIRFTGPNNPVGVGIIPFYRFYQDGADDAAGFNQLQRGASPGGGGANFFNNRGDIGLIGFADARVRSYMNISANVGYIYNSEIKADLGDGGDDVTLLDRGNELLAAFAVDFPVNKYFQPIVEFRSQQFVGGRTPNAFENNPLDGLAGARVFFARYIGISAAYRYHFNQQDRDSFDSDFTNSNTTVFRGNTVSRTSSTGVPAGFRTSSDPHGFMFQFFAGRRNERQAEIINIPPVINTIELSETTVKLPCPEGQRPKEGEVCSDDQTVDVRVNATDAENDVLTYNYTVSGGRVEGTGANVSWDLSGVNEGTYTITTTIDDGCGVCAAPKTETVTVASCDCEEPPCDCGTLSINAPPSSVNPGETLTFSAEINGGDQQGVTYNWSVDKGEIISGQGTSSITVSTNGLSDESVEATLNTSSNDAACVCNLSRSETGNVVGLPTPRLFDEFGNVANNVVRGNIDNFITELQNNPGSQGYVLNYGTAAQVRRRENLIRNQFELRGYPLSNIVFVNGGVESEIRTRLWIVPQGADPSQIDE